MVRREMKSDVTYVDSGPDWHAEGLNRAIEVLVVNGVLIVPYTGGWVGYFINNKGTTIDVGLRLDRHAGCASPGVSRRFHSNCLIDRSKREIGGTGNIELPI